jgi:hypothetical protein
MSDYVELMHLRRLAILNEDEELAYELLEMCEELVRLGMVSDEEMMAAAYL